MDDLYEVLLWVILKITGCLVILSVFGFINGVVIIIGACKLFAIFVKNVMGLTPLTPIDYEFLSNTSPKGKYMLIAYLEFSNFDINSMKDYIYNKLISKCPKMQMKLFNFLGNYYWKRTSNQTELLSTIRTITTPISKSNILSLIETELNTHINSFTTLPYEFILIPLTTTNKGIVLYKYDHILGDGLGLVSSLCMLVDNCTSNDIYPKLMRNMHKPSFIQNLYLLLVSPYYIIKTIYTLSTQRISNCIYKGDTMKQTFKTKIHCNINNSFKLKSFENYRKQHKVSFNDIITSAFSIAYNNILHSKHKQLNHIALYTRIGRKDIVNNISQLPMYNEAAGVLCDIPLISNVTEIKRVTKALRANIRTEYMYAWELRNSLIQCISHWKVFQYINKTYSNVFDFLLSNIPGPAITMTYNNSTCDDCILFPGSAWDLPMVIVFSYNDKFNVMICVNESNNAQCDLLLNEFETALTQFIM